MKTLLLSLLTGAVAFAAGWFLKPEKTVAASVAAKMDSSAGAPAGTGRAANPFRDAMQPSSEPGTVPIEPFRSAEEVLVLIEELMTGDEMAQIELLSALSRLMVTDIPVVVAMLEQLAVAKTGNHDARGMAAAILAARWVMQEPEKATGYLVARQSGGSEDDGQSDGVQPIFEDNDAVVVVTTFGVLLSAKRNPAAAQTLARLLPEGEAKELQEMLSQMEAQAAPAKFLTSSTPEQRKSIDDLTPVLTRWARTDPAAAAQWADAHGEEVDNDALNAIGAAWARTDRPAAIAWASGLADESQRYPALMEIAEQAVADVEPAAAEAELAAFPADVADSVRMEQLSNGSESNTHAAELVRQMAVKYADDAEMSTRVAGHTAFAVREIMSNEDGSAQATAWIGSLPEGESRAAAAAHLIDQWAGNDPEAASAWIKAMAAGETRERATGQLVEEISRDDPAGAVEWARTLSAEGSRQEKLREVFQTWLPKEPEKAMQVLQSLPAEERAGLFGSEEKSP